MKYKAAILETALYPPISVLYLKQ